MRQFLFILFILLLLFILYDKLSAMSHQPFFSLPTPTPDPLFAIAAEAKKAGAAAINGTIGIVMDEEGKPLLLPSVRTAIESIAPRLSSMSYSYPPLTGLPEFRDVVHALLPRVPGLHIASIASTGGTGALAINLRLMRMLLPEQRPTIILPVPAWGNHPPPCRAANLQILEVPYLHDGAASIHGIVAALKNIDHRVGLLLQVGCHNPTGLDLTLEQWRELASIFKQKDVIVLMDFAYQGFISEPEEDAGPIQLMLEARIPTLVTWSASKNHSIYALRTGLACAYTEDPALVSTIEGHYSSITRMLHSASPTFGQAIVADVQQHHRMPWLQDLRDTRAILDRKRQLLIDGLPSSFTASLRGHGMFAQLPLTEAQIIELKDHHNVFMTLDGRINIAGIPEKRIGELCGKVKVIA